MLFRSIEVIEKSWALAKREIRSANNKFVTFGVITTDFAQKYKIVFYKGNDIILLINQLMI